MKLISLVSAGLTAVAAGFATAQPAQSQEAGVAQARYVCLPHEEAVAKLENRFGEQAIAMGVGQDQKSVIELFVSQKGSWTILLTLNNGLACITAAGEKWTDIAGAMDQMS
jgi:hypothetical protein